MTEPKRMLDDDSVAIELRQALRLLQQLGPSESVAAVVEQQLQTAGGALAWTRSFGWIVPVGLAFVMAGAFGIFTLARQRSMPAKVETEAAAALPGPVTAQASPPVPLPSAAQPPAVPQPRAHSVGSTHAPKSSAMRRAPSRNGAAQSGARATPMREARLQSALGSSADQSVTTPQRDDPDAALAAPQPALARAKQPLQPSASAPEDEAGLLYRAKAAEGANPAAALRMLERHAEYFPTGQFAEEREALMIRLEQRLGHGPRARQRAERFRELFPHSVYSRSIAP